MTDLDARKMERSPEPTPQGLPIGHVVDRAPDHDSNGKNKSGNKLLIAAGGIFASLLAAGALVLTLGSDGNSDDTKVRAEGKPNQPVTSLPENATDTTETVSSPTTEAQPNAEATPLPYEAELYIQDTFKEHAKDHNITVLDGVSLTNYLPENATAVLQENPAIAIVKMENPQNAIVNYSYAGGELADNETMVFITERPDGTLDIIQSMYVTEVYVNSNFSGVHSPMQDSTEGLSYSTVAGQFENTATFFDNDVRAGIDARLASTGRGTTSGNLPDMLLTAFQQ